MVVMPTPAGATGKPPTLLKSTPEGATTFMVCFCGAPPVTAWLISTEPGVSGAVQVAWAAELRLAPPAVHSPSPLPVKVTCSPTPTDVRDLFGLPAAV